MDHTIFTKDAATLNKRVWRLIAKESSCALYPSMQILHGPFLHPYYWQPKQRKRVSTFHKVPNSSLPPIFFILNFSKFNFLISMRRAGTQKDQNHYDRDVHNSLERRRQNHIPTCIWNILSSSQQINTREFEANQRVID